ncbi:hypothetical protein FQN60_009762 [Etheostoma spectabile]|uniref:Integrase catalytic domain-containing protein n=1 Tax=Etheostoma spectabile TaxID=54343 RepID=A0A5J5DJQ9_9PERO|nr:hypothetical protein FQN60_009762 [Etheostoma spectabile]
MDFFYKYGASKRILTDQGKEIVFKIYLDMCAKLGIARSLYAPYHPQTNGLVERLNGTIQGALKKVVRGHQSNWDDCIRPTITNEEVNALAGSEEVTLTSKLSDVYPKVEANILAAHQSVQKRKLVQPNPLKCPRVPQSPISTQSTTMHKSPVPRGTTSRNLLWKTPRGVVELDPVHNMQFVVSSGHQIPRPYPKVASIGYKWRHLGDMEKLCNVVIRRKNHRMCPQVAPQLYGGDLQLG